MSVTQYRRRTWPMEMTPWRDMVTVDLLEDVDTTTLVAGETVWDRASQSVYQWDGSQWQRYRPLPEKDWSHWLYSGTNYDHEAIKEPLKVMVGTS